MVSQLNAQIKLNVGVAGNIEMSKNVLRVTLFVRWPLCAEEMGNVWNVLVSHLNAPIILTVGVAGNIQMSKNVLRVTLFFVRWPLCAEEMQGASGYSYG